MKKQLFTIFLACITLISIEGFSQGGIYIYTLETNKLPPAIPSGVHADETEIESLTRSVENSNTVPVPGGGGTTVGKVVSNGITLFKQYSKPSIYFKEILFKGDHLTKMEIRFYNNQNQIYYRITLGSVYLADFKEESEGCNSGCPGISEEIKIIFAQIKEEDVVTGAFKCWDFTKNSATCP